eukprot:11167262-Karenia_brevis.AAC.1
MIHAPTPGSAQLEAMQDSLKGGAPAPGSAHLEAMQGTKITSWGLKWLQDSRSHPWERAS